VGEADLLLAGAGDILEADACVLEVDRRGLVHAVAGKRLARVEVEGHDHRVLDRRHLHAMAGEDVEVIFEVVPDLDHAVVGEQGFQKRERGVERHLRRSFAEHVIARLVRERDVTGAAGAGGQADADQAGFHAVQPVGLGIDGDDALMTGVRDPAFELLDGGHGFIASAVDRRQRFGLGRGRRAFGRGGGGGDRHGGGRRPDAGEQRLEAVMGEEVLQRLGWDALQCQVFERLGQVHAVVQGDETAG
jgi:hypothetical protein